MHGDEWSLLTLWLTFVTFFSSRPRAKHFLIASACIWVGQFPYMYTVIMATLVTKTWTENSPQVSRAYTDQVLLCIQVVTSN